MNKKFSAIVAILAVAVLLSIFTISVYATDVTTTGADGTTTTEAATTTTPSSTTTKAPTTTTAPSTTAPAAEPWGAAEIVPLVILGVAIIAAVIVFFGIPKYREKTFKLARSVKSECKKVSWFSWKNTRKATLVVIICVVALAIVIGLLDFLFGEGISVLTRIF